MPKKGQFKDLVGMRFGKLVVQNLHHEQPKEKSSQAVRYWFCVCDCGGTIVIRGSHLNMPSRARAAITRSCGCERIKFQHGEAWKAKSIKSGTAFRLCLSQYKSNASNRGLVWDLTDEKFRELTSSPCHYTGKMPSTKKTARSGETYVYNGIDRVDSNLGYTLENCVPCCEAVNRMKMDLSKEEFINLCREIVKRTNEFSYI